MKLVYLVISIVTLFSCNNEHDEYIKSVCLDCEQIEVDESNLILIKNLDGLCNVYSKSAKTLLLEKWYRAKFNPGIFYDDITFIVNGKDVMCPETEYNLISDQYLNDEVDKKNNIDTDQYDLIYCRRHNTSYEIGDRCKTCYQEELEKKLFVPN